jgi:AraC family transcriptional regulator, regulatory protein of adaptative response / methylated-DNA-[protein]-cysteine methyltransferase
MNEASCWAAVEGRDRAADGQFVFAVRSTGIYCRPSCPARRPGRAQVEFYARPEVAEQAGYRACRRCRPGATGATPHAATAAAICRHIEAHADAPLTLDALGALVGLSPAHAQRVFKATMGVTPRQYADAVRLRRLQQGLRAGQDVTTALYDAGYSGPSRLYERAPAQLGMTPATYRRGGPGARIAYTTAACPLGRLLVAATAQGVCAVELGDADAALEAELRRNFPRATITRDDAELGGAVAAILQHLAGARPTLDLPIDAQGTAFQRRVWQALQAIPYGETRTYGALAAAIGAPRAARAVGRACATNPVALIVPCHRAVGADGGLTGYYWGLERKAALLAAERAGAQAPEERNEADAEALGA